MIQEISFLVSVFGAHCHRLLDLQTGDAAEVELEGIAHLLSLMMDDGVTR